jgi:hypothetical protein
MSRAARIVAGLRAQWNNPQSAVMLAIASGVLYVEGSLIVGVIARLEYPGKLARYDARLAREEEGVARGHRPDTDRLGNPPSPPGPWFPMPF